MLARCLLSEDNKEDLKIFYSYSRKDSGFRSLIDEVLGKFKWDVEVRSWYDGEIKPGENWASEIDHNLDTADIVLLFITQQFIDSDYCKNIELPASLDKHKNGECTVVPIIIEETTPDWRTLPFSHLQVLPQNGQPLSQSPDQQKAIRSLAQSIVNIIVNSRLQTDQRVRWQLYLEGTQENLKHGDELNIIREIRDISKDQTARPIALGEGSIVLFMESSPDALSAVKLWSQEQHNPAICGKRLLRVIELYGAGIQTKVQEITHDNDIEKQHVEHSDSLLFPSEEFDPTNYVGMEIKENNPLTPDFIIDPGSTNSSEYTLTQEANRLVDYFLTSMASPDNDLWVNLAPDEKNRMLGKSLAGTALGHNLLELDIKLKRLAASLMHPDSETGRIFWQEVFACDEGSRLKDKTIYNTFQRVWIVPKEACLYSPEDGKILILESSLDVLCEDDYLSKYSDDDSTYNANNICTPLFKKIVLPVIQKEINKGKNFHQVRQIYNCMILASWLKENYKQHPEFSQYYNTGKPEQLSGTLLRTDSFNLNSWESSEKTQHENRFTDNKEVNNFGSAKNVKQESDEIDQDRLNIAIRLRNEMDFNGSFEILSELVERSIDVRGKSIQFTQEAMSQLGLTLRQMGKLDDAKTLHKEVLEFRRFILGEQHPKTIDSMEILSDTLFKKNENEAAVNLREEAISLRNKFGEAFEIEENQKYFEKYMRIFREGVFSLVRDELYEDEEKNTRVTRSYFSGAVDFRRIYQKVIWG